MLITSLMKVENEERNIENLKQFKNITVFFIIVLLISFNYY